VALVDKLIQALHAYKGRRLTIVPGRPVTLATDTSERPISSKQVTQQQVEDLIQQSAPPDVVATCQQDGRHTYVYASPHGDVEVRVVRRRGVASLDIDPAPKGASASPAPRANKAKPDPAPAKPAAKPAAAKPDLTNMRPGAAQIEHYFLTMVREKCSDLHLCAETPPMYRKDGDMVVLDETEPLSAERSKELLREIMPKRNEEEFVETNDTDFAYEIPGVARFRCNVFMDRKGWGGVFRQIPDKILTAEDLKLSKHILDLCRLNKGLVVVTGPTGSGKSTTLAAMVDFINRTRPTHIITIEDPIEFVHPNKTSLVNQREIGVHTEGFKVALRAALREDPDIVLGGEMRDIETVAIAIETAETGHLVFGTLHTNTAPSTVDRIIDQFPTAQQAQIRTMLSESLRAVIAQTLLKRKGGGRIAALEVLIVTPAVANLIREGKTFQIPSMMQTGRNVGMITLNDALLELVRSDKVEMKEAYYKAVDKEDFKRLCERNGIMMD